MDAQASMATSENRYLAVHDIPPERKQPLMAPAEQARIKDNLIAARSRQSPTPAATKGARDGARESSLHPSPQPPLAQY
jgi:hypothetical protein